MGRLKSRKFWLAVGSVVALVLVDLLGVDLDKDTIAGVVATVGLYLAAQGYVDSKKPG